MRSYLVPRLGAVPVSALTPDDLRRYRLWVERHSLAPQTVAHILADCRCFLRWCEEGGHIDRAPVPRRFLPRIQQRPPDRLSDDQVAFLVALPPPHGWVCRLALGSGLRWSELVRAQASDVVGECLVVHQTKSGRLRRVPLPPDLHAEIRGRVGRLVPFRGASCSFNHVIQRRPGLERFHAHQLRHTFACLYLERGGSLAALQEIMGHASVMTTQRYAGLRDAAILDDARRTWASIGR